MGWSWEGRASVQLNTGTNMMLRGEAGKRKGKLGLGKVEVRDRHRRRKL